MLRDMIAKIIGKRPINVKDFETRTTIGELLKTTKKLKAMEGPTELQWMKDIKNKWISCRLQ